MFQVRPSGASMNADARDALDKTDGRPRRRRLERALKHVFHLGAARPTDEINVVRAAEKSAATVPAALRWNTCWTSVLKMHS